MIKKPKFYVYQHIYNDGVNSRIVYIGKGSVDKNGYDKRAYNFYKRNQKYSTFINEVGRENIKVMIIARFKSESDAIYLENELHELYDDLFSISNKQMAEMHFIPVVQLTLDSEFIAEYKSESDAAKQGFEPRNISACCKKKRSTYKGFKWLYADEYYKGDYTFKENERNIPVVVISKDNISFFDNCEKCRRELKIIANDISNRKNRYSRKYDLFVMTQEEYNNESYEELIIKHKIGIVQLDKDNNFINYYTAIYKTPKEFINTNISKCINKKRKSYKGYKWMSLEDYLAS